MAAPEWFVAHLDALRRVPGSRPSSARTLADWAAQVGDSEAPSRPTISRWLSGTTLPTGFRQLELMVVGVREHSRNPPRRVQETLLRSGWWQDAYERALAESGRGDAAAGQHPRIVYQGLEPFGREDTDRFFGRSSVIEAMRARLDDLYRSPTGGILMVLGQSGIGKSSVLAAGLLPAVKRDGLGSELTAADWPAVVITPGADPLAALAAPLDADGSCSSAETVAERLAADRRIVLVVDQFEEIFQVDEDVRRRFVDTLVEATKRRTEMGGSGSGDTAAVVIIACRNEFYPDLRRLPSLKSALDTPFNLDPLTGAELTEAIREPARRAGITVGNDLVARLLADAGVSDGGTIEGKLPLISHVLRLMNQAGPMTVRAYERVGGIDGAVTHTATQAWDELKRAGIEDTALALLVRLVRVGDYPGHDTRRRLDRRELPSSGAGRAERALEILSTARLVTISEDTVHITHDALVRAWQQLRDTIDSERADHVQRQNIAIRARQWDEAGRPPEQLLRGTVLTDAHRVTTRGASAADIDGVSRQFLAASDRQDCLAATRRRRLLAAAIVAAVLIVTAGTVAVIAGVAENRASGRAILAEVIAQAKQMTPVDASLAAQLWLTAYRMQPSSELYTALLGTENMPLSRQLVGHTGNVRAVGQIDSTIISAGEDGTIRLWPIAPDGPPPATLTEPGPVTGLAVDPAHRIMISGASNAVPGQSALRVWNVLDPQHPTPLTGQLPVGTGERIAGLAISPDSRLLVVAVSDGTTRLWNIADPGRPIDLGIRLPGTTTSVYGSNASISPDSRTLAVAGDNGSTRLWNIADPARPIGLPTLTNGTGIAHAVAFSPTRRTLITGGGKSVLQVWDIADPARARLIAQPPIGLTAAPSILSVAISPDENTVAVGSADNTVTLWNISNPARLIPVGQPLAGHHRGVGALAFGPDGHTVLTGSADDTVRVWSLPATRLPVGPGHVTTVAFSHNGRVLATGGSSGDNSIHLWDTTDPAVPVPAGGPLPLPGSSAVNSIAINTDDKVLAAGSGLTVRMWDVRDPYHPRQLGGDLAQPSAVGGMAISPDSQTLAVGGKDGFTRLFRLTDPSRPAPLPGTLSSTPNQLVGAVRFSPDGRILATAGADDQIRLWDTADSAHPRLVGGPLRSHTDQIFQIAFSPDGTRLASVGANHSTHIWDIRDPAQPREGKTLLEQTETVGGVSWSADGATLVTGSDDKTLALWDMTDPAGGHVIGDPITGHTDNIYATSFGPRSVLASGGRDRTVLLWNLDVDQAIRRVCQTTPGTLTPEAWDTYVSPDRSYDPPCGEPVDDSN